jgi:hypothetical protein
MTKTGVTAASSAVLIFALAGCEAQKSSNPLSPSVAGPIPGVNISAPKLIEPAQGFKYKESQQPIKLVVENATSNGVRPMTYMFEVATDSTFTTKVYARSGVPPGDGGRTSVQIDRLDLGRAYYWRAKADDGANSSQFSSSQFEVLPKPLLNPPGPVSPVNNDRVASRKPTLTVNNSDRNAAIGTVSYEFQIATDQAFSRVVASGVSSENPGQTSYTAGADLAADLQHFWRVGDDSNFPDADCGARARPVTGSGTRAGRTVRIQQRPGYRELHCGQVSAVPGCRCVALTASGEHEFHSRSDHRSG